MHPPSRYLSHHHMALAWPRAHLASKMASARYDLTRFGLQLLPSTRIRSTNSVIADCERHEIKPKELPVSFDVRRRSLRHILKPHDLFTPFEPGRLATCGVNPHPRTVYFLSQTPAWIGSSEDSTLLNDAKTLFPKKPRLHIANTLPKPRHRAFYSNCSSGLGSGCLKACGRTHQINEC